MKTQRRKRLLTRRRAALRHIALCLTLMLLIQHVMHLGLLLPIQTVRQQEERAGIRHTRVVERRWTPEVQRTNLAFLTENDQATLFSSCHLTLYGWMANFHVAVDCTGEEPLYGGFAFQYGDEERAWYGFGRVDDPEIQRVELSLQSQMWDSAAQSYYMEEVRRLTDIPLEEQSGRRYFLVKDSGEWDSEKYSTPQVVVIGYDSHGNELFRTEIEDWIATMF